MRIELFKRMTSKSRPLREAKVKTKFKGESGEDKLVLVEIGGVQISRTKLIASQVDSRNSLMVY